MPRLSPDAFLAQKGKATTTPTKTPVAGFDPAKYQQLQTQAATPTTPPTSGSVLDRVKADTDTKRQGFRDLAAGAAYGFSSLGRGVQRIATKIGIRADDPVATKESYGKTFGADLNSTSGKVGNFLGEAALYTTPGGASMAPARLGFRAAAAGATEAISTNSIDTGTGAAAAANAFLPPAISKTVSIASKLFTNAAKGTAGVVGGKGSRVIEEIYKNPEAARQGMREAVSISDDAAVVRKSVSNIAKRASDEFADDLDNLPKRLGRTPQVITDKTKTTIKVDGKTYTLSKQGIKSQLTHYLREFDVVVDPKKKTFDFSEAPLDKAESARLKEVFEVIDEWKDTTPKGFHKLARKIENYRRPGEQSAELNAIIDSVSRNTRGYITKRIPAAKTMLEKYAKAKDIIGAFDQELATDGRFVGGAADRIQTEKKVANLFSGEKTSANEMLRTQIPGGEDVIGRQAGRMLSEQVPRNASSIGDVLRSVVNMVITPKMVGETAAWLGTTAPKAERFLMQIKDLEPAARGVVISAVASLLESEDEGQIQ